MPTKTEYELACAIEAKGGVVEAIEYGLKLSRLESISELGKAFIKAGVAFGKVQHLITRAEDFVDFVLDDSIDGDSDWEDD